MSFISCTSAMHNTDCPINLSWIDQGGAFSFILNPKTVWTEEKDTIIMGQPKGNCSRKRQILWYLLLCSRITSKWIKTLSITSLSTPAIIREIIHIRLSQTNKLHLGFFSFFFHYFPDNCRMKAFSVIFWTSEANKMVIKIWLLHNVLTLKLA